MLQRLPLPLGAACCFLWLLMWTGGAGEEPPAEESTAEQPADAAAVAFFENEIRPLLVARCYECHGPDSKAEGGLRVDSLDALLAGGDSGAALVPGSPDASLLIDAVRYGDVFKMPPKSRLPEAEIAALEVWVRQGAVWPHDPSASAPSGEIRASAEITAEDRLFWAFQPPVDPPLPDVVDSAWPRSPLDRFVLAKLEAAGLSPAPQADKRTLVRRATFDLIGLPPTPEEVAAFLADDADDAFARLVDRLLASPHYGERWGRHWLDVARYADSNGMDENLAFEHAWRYRDYVVRAFNDDKPYDQFVREQVAGDLLPVEGDQEATLERLTATGFLSLGPKMLAEDDPVKMEMDIIDEQVDTVGRAFLGLTLGCARCHDHKFDPLPTEDYYALAGIFKSTKTMQNHRVVAAWNERPLASAAEIAVRDEQLKATAELREQLDGQVTAANDALLASIRGRAADYLLAAMQLAERPEAQPSQMAQDTLPAGAIVVEAESYPRGNLKIDLAGYGDGIGVVYNAGELPNVCEYDIEAPAAGAYQLELRYAAAESRGVAVLLNGTPAATAAASVTGTWYPDTQTWEVVGLLPLAAGRNVLRLERDGPFPHLDKLALIPFALPPGAAIGTLATPEQLAAERQLLPTVVKRWRDSLAAAENDPASPLFAWHVWRGQTPDLSAAVEENSAAQQVLREPRPTTMEELAARYAEFFAAAIDREASGEGDSPGEGEAPAEPDSIPASALEAVRPLLYDPAGLSALPEMPEKHYPAEVSAAMQVLRDEIARQEAAAPKLPLAMAVEDQQPQDLQVHIRGNHLTLGEVAPRGFLRVVALSSPPAIDAAHSGRLQLADWLSRPDHPLTARVMVNRLWRWHFGQGLVRSPDNFGRLGEAPTHPELLDWLAVRFVESGWSVKALHRAIVLSATYQMSTTYDERSAAADPENRLWWRRDRRRMEAETVRDAILAVSGRLDREVGGSLLKSRNREYVAGTASVNTTNYDSLRRSVYLPVVRSALYEVFQAFDFADPSVLNGGRDTTTVAPQALFMMNGPIVLAESRALAEALLGGGFEDSAMDAAAIDDAGRVRTAYLRCFGRAPAEEELARALEFVARYEQAQAGRADAAEARVLAWQALCRTLLATNEFIYVE